MSVLVFHPRNRPRVLVFHPNTGIESIGVSSWKTLPDHNVLWMKHVFRRSRNDWGTFGASPPKDFPRRQRAILGQERGLEGHPTS